MRGTSQAEAVRRQQQVQRAGGAQLVPGVHRLADAARAQPDRAERGVRVAVDRLQHVLAVGAQQLLGAGRGPRAGRAAGSAEQRRSPEGATGSALATFTCGP